MKIELKTISSSVSAFTVQMRRYAKMMFFTVAAVIIGYLVIQINLLANSEPTPEQISEKLLEVRRPRVDEKTVRVLEDLEDNNTSVQSIFQQARDNPFSE